MSRSDLTFLLLFPDSMTAAELKTLLRMLKANGTMPSVLQVKLELSPGNSTMSGLCCLPGKKAGGKGMKKACNKVG